MLVESQDDPKTLRYQALLYLHTLYLSTFSDINNMEIESLILFHLIMSFEIFPLVEGICHAMKKFTEAHLQKKRDLIIGNIERSV